MASAKNDYGLSKDNPARPTTDLATLVVKDFTGKFNNAALELHISIQKSMNIDLKINEKQAEIGFTALHWAVSCGNVEGARILVKNGANVHVKDVLGFTPLFYCTGRAPNVEMTKFLVEKCKANIMEKSKTDVTCLHGAALKGKFMVFLVLVILVILVQSCKTCSYFLQVKFKVFNLPQNIAFSNSKIQYTFKTMQNLKLPCY